MGWSGATPVLSWKDSVRVATAAALPAVTYANGTAGVGATLTADAVGVLTVDGFATVLGDRILVKNQVAGLQNGVYDVTVEGTAGVAAVLTRAPTSDEAAEVPSEAVFAQEGTANSDSGFTQTADEPITMGTTALVYVQFTGLGQITAGTGMTKTGNTLNVIGGTGITANADDIQTDPGCDSTAIHDNVAGEITAITEKTTLTATEIVLIEDPADSDNKKRVQLSNLPAGSTALLVRKGSAGTITKGSPVYISGFNVGQNVPEVEEAKADAAGTMPAIGIAAESITNTVNGDVAVSGRLSGFDTSSFSGQDLLFVSAATAGTLTATRPTGATDLIQLMGEVLRSHASMGEFEIFGAGRSNAEGNLTENSFFVGDSNNHPSELASTGTGSVVRATSPTIVTPFIAEVVGSSGAAGTLTVRATSNATPGAIIFEVEPGVEARRILATGETVQGVTSLTAAADIGEWEKNQNDQTVFTLRNTTDGTSALTGVRVHSAATDGMLAAMAPSRTPVVGFVSSATNLVANIGDLALVVREDKPIRFGTDGNTDTVNSERAQINKTAFQPGADGRIALGVPGTGFAGLALESGAVIDFGNGNLTLTHSTGLLTLNEAGADVDLRVEGDTLTHMLFTEGNAASENIALLAAALPNWQSMDRGIFLGDATTAPTGNPSAGGFLYVTSGALQWRGSSGTVTELATA